MIIGYHKLNILDAGHPLACQSDDCKSTATIALHEQWRRGEPVDFSISADRYLFYCEPCALAILTAEDQKSISAS